jgi:hypothetical protein
MKAGFEIDRIKSLHESSKGLFVALQMDLLKPLLELWLRHRVQDMRLCSQPHLAGEIFRQSGVREADKILRLIISSRLAKFRSTSRHFRDRGCCCRRVLNFLPPFGNVSNPVCGHATAQ